MDFPAPAPSARFLVLSGPSGAGKSTVMAALCARLPGLARCLSLTTRPPRGQERDGIDYHFVSEADFTRIVDAGGLLEWARVFGRHAYGTPRADVEGHLAAGRSVIKDVDVQGAEQIRASFPAAIHIFLSAPSFADIEGRLRGRGTESEDQVRRRLEEAGRELARWRSYDYLVVNRDVEDAAAQIAAILRAEGLRIRRP